MTDFARAVPGRVAPAPVAETERWIGRAAAVLPGGALNVLQWPNRRPLVVSRGCGATIVDVDGGEYVDFLLGSGPLIVGHAHPHVVEAVQAQASEGSTFYALNRPAIELAERIVQHVPCAELVRFCSTGSEAVFFALRIARAVTGRNAILKFEGAFHGSSDYALMSVTPKRDLRYPLAEPETAGVSNAVTEGVLVAPYNDAEATAALVREHAESLAAVIVEPVQRAIPPVSGFLQALRRITQEHGILLIFDEVVTGFRLGLGGAQGLYGVIPDIAAYGKAVGGGYPLAAVVGRREVMETVAPPGKSLPAYVSGTLSGNPVAAAAGLATIDILEQPGTYDHLFSLGAKMRAKLAEAFESSGHKALVLGVGPIFQVLLPTNDVKLSADQAINYRRIRGLQSDVDDFSSFLLNRGFLYTGRKGYLSTAHDERQVDRAAQAAAEWTATKDSR